MARNTTKLTRNPLKKTGGDILDDVVSGSAQAAPDRQEAPEKPARPKRVRQSVYADDAIFEALRNIAWWDRKSLTQVIDVALSEYVEKRQAKYEKETGEPFPKRGGDLPRGPVPR